DSPLVERLERVREPGDPSGVTAELALEPVEPLPLSGALVLLDDRAGLARDLGRARLDVDVEPAGDPVTKVAVDRALDLAAHLIGRADDEPADHAALRELEQLLGSVLEVVLGLLLDPALESSL